MKIRCYLVLAKLNGGRVRARRATTKKPDIAANEALVQLELDLPDDVFETPLFSVEVEKRHVVVGVEPIIGDDGGARN